MFIFRVECVFRSTGAKDIYSKMLQCCMLNGGIFWVSTPASIIQLSLNLTTGYSSVFTYTPQTHQWPHLPVIFLWLRIRVQRSNVWGLSPSG